MKHQKHLTLQSVYVICWKLDKCYIFVCESSMEFHSKFTIIFCNLCIFDSASSDTGQRSTEE